MLSAECARNTSMETPSHPPPLLHTHPPAHRCFRTSSPAVRLLPFSSFTAPQPPPAPLHGPFYPQPIKDLCLTRALFACSCPQMCLCFIQEEEEDEGEKNEKEREHSREGGEERRGKKGKKRGVLIAFPCRRLLRPGVPPQAAGRESAPRPRGPLPRDGLSGSY